MLGICDMRKYLVGLVLCCVITGFSGFKLSADPVNTVSEHKVSKPVLLRITKERFDAQRKLYKRLFSNQKWRQRLLYCSAGAAATGGVILFINWLLVQNAPAGDHSKDVKKLSKSKAGELYNTARLTLYEEELELRRYKRTLWGSIDNGVRQGLGLAFASFVTAFVLNHMDLFSHLFKEKYKEWFQPMDANEYALLQELMKSQVKIFGNTLIESVQPADNSSHASVDNSSGLWDEAFVDRITYISGDLVADQAAWVTVIEKLFAFVLESLHESGIEEQQRTAFESSMYRCIAAINFFSEKLELCIDDHGVIRDDQNAQKLMLLLKKNCRDIFQIVRAAGTVLYGQTSKA